MGRREMPGRGGGNSEDRERRGGSLGGLPFQRATPPLTITQQQKAGEQDGLPPPPPPEPTQHGQLQLLSSLRPP